MQPIPPGVGLFVCFCHTGCFLSSVLHCDQAGIDFNGMPEN